MFQLAGSLSSLSESGTVSCVYVQVCPFVL